MWSLQKLSTHDSLDIINHKKSYIYLFYIRTPFLTLQVWGSLRIIQYYILNDLWYFAWKINEKYWEYNLLLNSNYLKKKQLWISLLLTKLLIGVEWQYSFVCTVKKNPKRKCTFVCSQENISAALFIVLGSLNASFQFT
jgi:hypothetical protein